MPTADETEPPAAPKKPEKPVEPAGWAWLKDRTAAVAVTGVVRHAPDTPFLRAEDGMLFHEHHYFPDQKQAVRELWRHNHDKLGKAEQEVEKHRRALAAVEAQAAACGVEGLA